MFSILICSVNATYLENLKINIRETIGNEYELLVWDNLAETKPITEVYNLLAARARYPYCCFIHEDIRFQTINWSANLLLAFDQNKETGLIGIAGAKYKSRTASGWSTGIPNLDYSNIFHKDKNGITQHLYNNSRQSVFEPVVNVDGVFIAIRSEVWKNARFNEDLLRGFHLYDIDFSFHAIKKWRAAVIFNIDILHFTEGGNFGNEWVENTLQWHKHFSKELPQTVEGITASYDTEKKIGKNWLYRLYGENISWNYKWKWIRAGKTWMDPTVWPYIGIFLFGKYFIKAKSLKHKA
ncbi:MAG TPA: glycosyltransferase [Puia sp.]